MGLCLALAGCGGQGSFADLPEVTPYPVPQGQTMRADLYFLDESGAGTLAVESREVDLSYREQGTYWQVIQELILGDVYKRQLPWCRYAHSRSSTPKMAPAV